MEGIVRKESMTIVETQIEYFLYGKYVYVVFYTYRSPIIYYYNSQNCKGNSNYLRLCGRDVKDLHAWKVILRFGAFNSDE